MLSLIVNILLFILIVGFLTLIHELGHFLVAKAIKAKVYEFSLGFGPKLISKKYKETEYCIRAIPLGGFVKILGDGDPSEYGKGKELAKSSENLNNKPKILQAFVMLAGVTMNILFAILFYYIILGMSGWKTSPIYVGMDGVNLVGVETEQVIAFEVIQDTNADIAGLPKYGIVKKIDGVDIESRDTLLETLEEKEQVSVLACDENQDNCTEYLVDVDEEGKMGMYVFVGTILNYNDIKGVSGPVYLVNNLKIIGKVLGSMIGVARETGDYSELSNTVSGPVGIFLLIDNVKTRGFVVFLSLVADLSISLAIMNLLPIPALDGGRVLILLVEGILKKDLDEKIEAFIINGSMIFLIILIVLVFVKDIINIDNMRNMFG